MAAANTKPLYLKPRQERTSIYFISSTSNYAPTALSACFALHIITNFTAAYIKHFGVSLSTRRPFFYKGNNFILAVMVYSASFNLLAACISLIPILPQWPAVAVSPVFPLVLSIAGYFIIIRRRVHCHLKSSYDGLA